MVSIGSARNGDPAAQRAIRYAEQVAVRYADGIAVLSRRIQAYFRNYYGRETTYIPNGLPNVLPPGSFSALSQFGLSREGYVLFAARLVPEKGCHDLLDAWRQLSTEIPLVIAGTAPAGDLYVEQLRSQADPARVIFTGHLEHAAMLEIMACCRLFVLPSYLEGMSNALLEAIALHRPILVSNIPENVEVLDGQGAIFAVGNVDALCAELIRLLGTSELLQGMQVDLARTTALRPRWSEVARLHVQLYEEAIALRNARRMRQSVVRFM